MHRTALVLIMCVISAASVASTGEGPTSQYVRMDTILGQIYLELFPEVTPVTVANFMNYVNDGDYVDSFIHRSVPGFVIQGGGFAFYPDPGSGVDYFWSVPADPPIVNEFSLSNFYGTIAMAKVGPQYDGGGNLIPGTGPDSATNQWFINLGDNLGLDVDNGGYTVFGHVIKGMDVVHAIEALQVWNATGWYSAFGELPLIDYAGGSPTSETLVMVYDVVALTPFSGDANFDGMVDLSDLAQLAGSYRQTTGCTWMDGDFNGDGAVDLSDLATLAGNYRQSAPVTPGAVPEPATLGLLGIGALALIRRRR